MSNSRMRFSGRIFFQSGLDGLPASLAAVAFAPQIGAADTASPWAKFVGNWRGSGEVIEADGTREHISCRGKYSTSSGVEALSLRDKMRERQL